MSVPSLLRDQRELIVCPRCGSSLDVGDDGIACGGCGTRYDCHHGIPLLFWPTEQPSEDDVTGRVRSFYEKHPFPSYDDLDSAASLQEKARRGLFARLLDEQIPDGARILDAGCGTGQLGNFLALTPGRTVVSADLCLRSLELAQEFKAANRIDNATFIRMNLFRPALSPESFDLVISNGVLHHTSAPFRAFQSLVRLVRPGGYFVLGLYNRYGRLATDLRRLVFRLTGDRFRFLDPRLRSAAVGDAKKKSWFKDQYEHPHESKHTVGEVLRWFDESGFEFVNAVPKLRPFEQLTESEQLFRPGPRGGPLDRALVQAGMVVTGGREGGLFVMIGRRKTPQNREDPRSTSASFQASR